MRLKDNFRLKINVVLFIFIFLFSFGYVYSDSYTKLLLHLDNNVIDSSNSAHTVTNNGVSFTTSPAKFGYSGYFDGSDYLSIQNNQDFNFGSNDFTIDFWAYKTQSATDDNMFRIWSHPEGASFILALQHATFCSGKLGFFLYY